MGAKFLLQHFYYSETGKNYVISGPELPFALCWSRMVTSPNGQGVIVMGGYKDDERQVSDSIIELSGKTIDSLKWRVLKLTLQFPRQSFVVLPISKDFYDEKLVDFSDPNVNNLEKHLKFDGDQEYVNI